MRFTASYRVLRCLTESYGAFYGVLPSLTARFTGSYEVLRSLTESYGVLRSLRGLQ